MIKSKTMNLLEAPVKCTLCPRLVQYRQDNQQKYPDWFNGAVPSFGTKEAELLIVGLAPGVSGANRTGRPFTGDIAGDLLYDTLSYFGFSQGRYMKRIDDKLHLQRTMITNAVRCVPPQNKPNASEIKQCRLYLKNRITALPKLKIILALGRIAHESIIATYDLQQKSHSFQHGKRHIIGQHILYDSYHCSRYNINTKRLTTKMFHTVFQTIYRELNF